MNVQRSITEVALGIKDRQKIQLVDFIIICLLKNFQKYFD